MTTPKLTLTEPLYQYLLSNSLREPEPLQQLRQETATLAEAHMQTVPEQGQFMHLLVKLTQAKRILEVGTFTGYSTAWMALALPADGQIIACDVSDEWTQIGQRYWQELGIAERIDLRLAPATETLESLLKADEAGQFDLMFIDADKTSYLTYYEQGLQLLRSGGLMLLDNTLWHGQVIDQSDNSDDTLAIRELNQRLHQDERIHLSMLPIADGLSLAMKI